MKKKQRAQVDYVIVGGVTGILAFGSNGEFYLLAEDEMEHGLRIIVDRTAGRVPVYFGIGAINAKKCCRLAKMAVVNGTAAVSVLQPMFLKPTHDELFLHFKTIAGSIPDTPVLLYNNPGRIGYTLTTSLVDELAHTNADGSKNDKRYSDVLEVLAQGINVISTINVQHLESVAARVEEATGIAVRERIPDTVLRRAEQVVNVDVTKEERLRQGKIYAPQQAERALSSFFTYENLSFLRELCLREASGDQVRKIEAQELLKPALAGYAVEAVMVALSSWPTDAESLIRRGVRMANQLGSPCYVVYVRRPQESPTRIDAGIQRQLQHNLQLATRLGAEVVQLEGVDIAETLVNFASERNVRHAIFGKSRLSPLRERLRGSFLLDFLYEAVGVDVHVANVTPKYIK